MTLPIPENEDQRIKALQEYRLLDTLPDEQFDRLTRLAAIICNVPIALITLIDKDRQWFKSKTGIELNQTSREFSFCQYTIMGNDFFEVGDAINDKRFSNNHLVVGDPNVRFYAAYPLVDPNGYALGSLCVIDHKPNKLSKSQKEALKLLSLEVMSQIINKKKDEERRSFEAFFEMSLDLICIAGADGYFKKINPAFTKTLGWTNEELFQIPYIELIHPKDMEKAGLKLISLIEGNKLIDFVCRFRCRDESYKLLHWTSNSDPITGQFFSIAHDVTEVKKVEEKLIKSELFNRGVINSLSSNIAVINRKGTIVAVNRAWDRFAAMNGVGSLAQTGVGANYFEVCEKSARAGDSIASEVLKGIREVFEKKCAMYSIEYPCHFRDTKLWFAMKVVMFEGDEQFIVTSHQDITQRKLAEEELKKSKYQADHLKGLQERFLVNVSHEIRTPMTAIVGFSSILENTGLDNHQKEIVSNINIASDNLLAILNDVMDISKIEAGMIHLEKTVLHLPNLLQNVYSIMMGKALEKGLEFSLRNSPGLPEYVIGDPTRLSQILINLLTNAIKFTQEGFVNIRTEINNKDSQKVLISFIIQDSGIGIAEKNREIIFERFKQESIDTKRKFGGTGIGLNIVKNIVNLSGGWIFVESELGKGSAFTVTIPFERCNDMQIEEYKMLQNKETVNKFPDTRKLKVLIVEDNRMNQSYCLSLLKEYGFSGKIAENGIESLQLLKKEKFDVILMDIQMPEMDGYEATGIIRNELKIRTPIIALTANAQPGEQKKCFQCGMNGYISKPFKSSDIYNKIMEVYHKKPVKVKGDFAIDFNEPKGATIKLIDMPFMKKQVHGNMEVVKELFEIFMQDTPGDIDRLNKALQDEDFLEIEKVSHQLVSSFSILGMSSAIKILKSMELIAGNQKDQVLIKNLLRQLAKLIGRARTQIRELKL